MRKILSVLTLCIVLLLPMLFTEAKEQKIDFNSVLKDFGVNTEAITISIKEVNSGKTIYKLNDKMLVNPASVQKILTTPVSYETLGNDYKFKTEIYQHAKGDYTIKLGADPYLTTNNIKNLINVVPRDSKRVNIDDTALDNKTWGEGWQWDDDMNILMPRFGSYNLDKNLIQLTIVPADEGKPATIINPSKYPLVFFNNTISTKEKNHIKITRDDAVSPNTITIDGTVSKPQIIFIPTLNLKKYFDVQLTRSLENRKVYMKEPHNIVKLQKNDILKAEISHDIGIAVNDILKNSNNMISETLFKLAGAKYCNLETGTDSAGIKMFNDYCVKNNLDNSNIKIVDASGVSKNNLISSYFITEFLLVNNSNPVMQHLPSPGEGTLANRMLAIKDFVKAKTGTLANISSIAGYLTARSGKKYVFCIISNDMKLTDADKKALEECIIRQAYIRL